jgi:hypothetical protein
MRDELAPIYHSVKQLDRAIEQAHPNIPAEIVVTLRNKIIEFVIDALSNGKSLASITRDDEGGVELEVFHVSAKLGSAKEEIRSHEEPREALAKLIEQPVEVVDLYEVDGVKVTTLKTKYRLEAAALQSKDRFNISQPMLPELPTQEDISETRQ